MKNYWAAQLIAILLLSGSCVSTSSRMDRGNSVVLGQVLLGGIPQLGTKVSLWSRPSIQMLPITEAITDREGRFFLNFKSPHQTFELVIYKELPGYETIDHHIEISLSSAQTLDLGPITVRSRPPPVSTPSTPQLGQ